jgi:glycine betaine/choline ABC-type transport system substrate-binding protein
MFGGYANGNLNDTWEYDGIDWTQVTTASSPSARKEHAMAYDSMRGKVVMFGGYATGQLNDTWEYDGVDWTQVTTASSPSVRRYHAMAYDSGRGKVVMFGGFANGNLSDTWEYDGVDWTQVTTTISPRARNDHAMAYDSVQRKVVMFGGYANGRVNETWEYDGVDWTQITPASSPSARKGHVMVYDSMRGKVVVFGGRAGNYTNDTWEYECAQITLSPSSATSYGIGCGSPALDFSSTSNPIIGATVSTLISNAPTSLGGVSVGFSNTFSFPVLLPFELSSVGMPNCYLLQSSDVSGIPAAPVTASTLQFTTAIPYSPALLTQQFYIQAYAFAPGANASQIVTSNGIAWTIGNH